MAPKIIFNERTKILLIAVATALITVVVAANIVVRSYNRIEKIRLDILEENKRLILRKDISKIDKIQDEYKKYLYNKADEYTLRGTLTDLARNSGVNIISVQPQAQHRFGDYIKLSLKLKVGCTYKQLGSFLAEIESLPTLTRIDDLALNTTRNYDTTAGEADSSRQDTSSDVSLTVSAYCMAR